MQNLRKVLKKVFAKKQEADKYDIVNIPRAISSTSSSSSSSSSHQNNVQPEPQQDEATLKKFLNTAKKEEKDFAEEEPKSNFEFENIKQEWQEELEQMSEFLVLKSTQQQKFEGVGQPVDTAYIDYKEGQPILRACFDIKYFKPEEVQLNVEEGFLTIFAQCLEEKEVALYKKTMIRKMELPIHVDHSNIQCCLSDDQKVLSVEMPFHLPLPKKHCGPSVLPIVCDQEGRKNIRLTFPVGNDFEEKDLKVSLDESRHCLSVEATFESRDEADQVTKRQFRKKFKMPDFICVDRVEHSLDKEGKLYVDVFILPVSKQQQQQQQQTQQQQPQQQQTQQQQQPTNTPKTNNQSPLSNNNVPKKTGPETPVLITEL